MEIGNETLVSLKVSFCTTDPTSVSFGMMDSMPLPAFTTV